MPVPPDDRITQLLRRARNSGGTPASEYRAHFGCGITEAGLPYFVMEFCQVKEEAILAKRQAEAQAAVAAATAADTATELATAGLVSGHALNAVEKTLDANDKARRKESLERTCPLIKGGG